MIEKCQKIKKLFNPGSQSSLYAKTQRGQNKIYKCEDFAEKSINAGHFFPCALVTLNRVSIFFGLIYNNKEHSHGLAKLSRPNSVTAILKDNISQ